MHMVAFNYSRQSMFQVNDVVAVVLQSPWGKEVMAVTRVKRIGDVLIETFDNRCFSVVDGASLNGRLPTHIELATPAHLLALRQHRLIR